MFLLRLGMAICRCKLIIRECSMPGDTAECCRIFAGQESDMIPLRLIFVRSAILIRRLIEHGNQTTGLKPWIWNKA